MAVRQQQQKEIQENCGTFFCRLEMAKLVFKGWVQFFLISAKLSAGYISQSWMKAPLAFLR